MHTHKALQQCLWRAGVSVWGKACTGHVQNSTMKHMLQLTIAVHDELQEPALGKGDVA
jgi:hypothetical protein